MTPVVIRPSRTSAPRETRVGKNRVDLSSGSRWAYRELRAVPATQINRSLIGVSVIIRVPPNEAFKIRRDDG
jgi:hypothetical protein